MPYGTGTYGSKVGRPAKKQTRQQKAMSKRKPSGNARGR